MTRSVAEKQTHRLVSITWRKLTRDSTLNAFIVELLKDTRRIGMVCSRLLSVGSGLITIWTSSESDTDKCLTSPAGDSSGTFLHFKARSMSRMPVS